MSGEPKSTPPLKGRLQKLISCNEELFHGIGKLKGMKVKLHIDESVKPAAQKHRRVPFHLRNKVEAELKRPEAAGIIETVDYATDWV